MAIGVSCRFSFAELRGDDDFLQFVGGQGNRGETSAIAAAAQGRAGRFKARATARETDAHTECILFP